MRKKPVVRSAYNKREKFSFDKTPEEFKSVTEETINKIKDYCTETIEEKYQGKYDAASLYAKVGTVMGNFDLLTSRLEEDYSGRRSKLKKAQLSGMKKVSQKLYRFNRLVAEHEFVLKRYSDNLKDYDGEGLPEELHYSRDRLAMFNNKLNIIEEKHHAA